MYSLPLLRIRVLAFINVYSYVRRPLLSAQYRYMIQVLVCNHKEHSPTTSNNTSLFWRSHACIINDILLWTAGSIDYRYGKCQIIWISIIKTPKGAGDIHFQLGRWPMKLPSELSRFLQFDLVIDPSVASLWRMSAVGEGRWTQWQQEKIHNEWAPWLAMVIGAV